MWHQVQLVPCHTTYSVQPLTIHIVLTSHHISCIMLSLPHSKVHKYLFQLLDSIITPNILPLFNDTRNIQPLESSFVWGEPSLACGWSVLCFLPLSLNVATCNRPSHPGCAFDQNNHAWTQIHLSRGPFAFLLQILETVLWTTFPKMLLDLLQVLPRRQTNWQVRLRKICKMFPCQKFPGLRYMRLFGSMDKAVRGWEFRQASSWVRRVLNSWKVNAVTRTTLFKWFT